MMMLAELHDFRRFQAPRALMAYLGLVPGEHSSRETPAGAHQTLVETAALSNTLARRRRGQPGRVIAIAARRNSGCVGASVPFEGHGGDRARTGRLRVGGAAARASRGATDTRGRVDARCAGAGPRGRRMIRGTSVRTGDYTMRYGRVSQRALLDCTSSRRSMVMRALPRLGVVTTETARRLSHARVPLVGSPRD